jgi:hypothetical protein
MSKKGVFTVFLIKKTVKFDFSFVKIDVVEVFFSKYLVLNVKISYFRLNLTLKTD